MCLGEFIDSTEAALRDRYYELMVSIAAVEVGVGRSLARVFTKKSPPEMPSWETFRDGAEKGDFDEELWWKTPPEATEDGAVDGNRRD
ncbi:hypothetical protein ACFLXE_00090 [Chloroflexota bacterium]